MVLFQQAVDVLHLHAGTRGDAALARAVDDRRIAAFLRRHGVDDGDHAAGLAVVASDVGGNAEQIVDGESGLLVPAARPDLLADAILKFVSGRQFRRDAGEAARRRVRERFSKEACTRGYVAAYSSVLSAKTGGPPRSFIRNL